MEKLRAAHDKIGISWTAPVLLAAAEEGQPRRWSARAYNGGPMRVTSPKLDAPMVVDLTGVTFSPSLVANLFHDDQRIVGHVTDKQIAAGALDMAGIVSGGGPDADHFLKASSEGFPWQASIEADNLRIEKLAAGKSAQINGRTVTGPAYIARKANVYGVAFLGRGADEGTSVTLAAGAASLFEENDMDYSKWLAALGFDDETKLTDAQKAKLKAKYDGEQADALKAGHDTNAPAFDLDGLKVEYAKLEAELEKFAFEAAGKVSAEKLSALKAGAMQKGLTLKANALAQEWAPQRFAIEAMPVVTELRLDLMKAEAPKGPAIHASHADLSNDVLCAAMASEVGLNVEKDYPDQVLQAAHTLTRRGHFGIQKLLLTAAAQTGFPVSPGDRIDNGNYFDVMQHLAVNTPLKASASVLSVTGILSNLANKSILDGFLGSAQYNLWRKIARIARVSDFKTHTSYRLLDNMEYEELKPDGSMRTGTIGEESFTRKAKTYAKMWSFTREDIINDDLGAFSDMRTRLGLGAIKKLSKLAWQTFINNSAFFTAARGNYISGATTNLGTDLVGLGLGVKAFNALASTAVAPATVGERIGGQPSMLLVPPELAPIGQQIYKDIGAVVVSGVNIYAGKYETVEVPWLSDSNYTGYSATAWYLLRSPAEMAAIVVSFLNGVESPTVEAAAANIGRLGIDMHGYHDFGVNQEEWLSGVKSKGSA